LIVHLPVPGLAESFPNSEYAFVVVEPGDVTRSRISTPPTTVESVTPTSLSAP
jgi:hypothetical protein